jgi:4-alpha-glucanotransferase
MGDNRQPLPSAPFAPGYRASGVLLHITCLPSPYGIGDVGPAACAWVDSLVRAGQRWWQVLPLGPTGYGNSPYQSPSSFAGNTLLISPDRLIEDGLLRPADVAGASFPGGAVDFDAVIPFKEQLLERAWVNFRAGARPDLRPAFDQNCHKGPDWLDDYALFMALKVRYGGVSYLRWPAELVRREPAALARARGELAEALERVRFEQFLLLRQWQSLKEYANGQGLRLIGDLPIFVSPDSADIWANPELYLVDDRCLPRVVAGVPPDYFSAQGQLWGNPLYNWDAHRRTGYRWWVSRLRASLAHLDLVRLDHFRGFEAAWHVPAGARTAEQGVWVPGPGADFFTRVREALDSLPFLAEDLGMITPEVRALRDRFHLPGMRVLQFAFDGMQDNPFLPRNFVSNTVVYTGTHDNDTTRSWYETLPDYQRQNLWNCLQRPAGPAQEVTWELIRLALSSIAAVAVVPLQDLLNLGTEARMNRPGQPEGNWRWRFTADMPVTQALQRFRDVTERSNRLPAYRPG